MLQPKQKVLKPRSLHHAINILLAAQSFERKHPEFRVMATKPHWRAGRPPLRWRWSFLWGWSVPTIRRAVRDGLRFYVERTSA